MRHPSILGPIPERDELDEHLPSTWSMQPIIRPGELRTCDCGIRYQPSPVHSMDFPYQWVRCPVCRVASHFQALRRLGSPRLLTPTDYQVDAMERNGAYGL